MARVILLVISGFIAFGSAKRLQAIEFKLTDGTTMRGEPTGVNQDGLVIRLDVGGFSPRISWARLSQETLRELTADPKIKPYGDPFIELPPEEIAKARAKKKEIILKPVPNQLERLPAKPGFLAAFTSPVGLLILGLLFAANIFAGYEIAIFRNRPVALVCGISAILPILGPLLFLLIPPATGAVAEESGYEAPAAEQSAATAGGGGLNIASAQAYSGGVSPLLNQAFTRSDTTLNRRFFETKFPGFFRLVPAEAEKDLVLMIRTPKAEYVGRRITRISMNELYLQLQKGGGTAEVMIPFVEIVEVKVRQREGSS